MKDERGNACPIPVVHTKKALESMDGETKLIVLVDNEPAVQNVTRFAEGKNCEVKSEKHYGQLQGLNKAETAEKYGEEQVLVWRRSYDVAPHALAEDDPRNPRFEVRYNEVPDAELPRTESLKDTIERIMPYWKCVIFPNLKSADELLVVAHGNSLRGIIKHLKGISDEDIVKLNLPTAVPYVFEFDDDLNLTKDYFLGDPEEIKKLMEAVANQGKK